MSVNQPTFDHSNWTSLIQLFEAQTARHHNRKFMRYQSSDTKLEFKTLTYGQFNCIASYLANQWLPQLDGVQCIAFLGGNPLQSLLTMTAISKLGRTFFPLSTGNSVIANTHLLAKANVGYLIASEKYGQKAQTSMKQLDGVRGHIWKQLDVEKLLALASASNSKFSSKQQALDDTPLILHSSGTTGLPKPVYLSNRGLLMILAIFPTKLKSNGEPLISDAETIMTTFSAFHMCGVWAYWLAITMGGSAIVFRKEPPSTVDLLTVIRKSQVTAMIAAPMHLENLAKLLLAEGVDRTTSDGLKKVKFCLYGGAPMTKDLGDFLKSSGLNIGNGYGTTEVSNIALASYSRDDKNYNGIKPTETASRYVKWEPYDNNGLCHLMIRKDYPLLSPTAVASIGASGYYETNDLFQEYPPKSGYWHCIRRIDEVIILSDGGKTDPVSLENEIHKANIVKRCVVVGHNRSNTAVLIELNLDHANKLSLTEATSEAYKAVHAANKAAAQKHSHIIVPDMVYILTRSQQLPITSKGTVARKRVLELFEKEIQKMYEDYFESVKASAALSADDAGKSNQSYIQNRL